MREDLVKVRVKGGGAAAFAAGQKYGLVIEAGQTADQWQDGNPITRGEFEDVLSRRGVFEIVPQED